MENKKIKILVVDDEQPIRKIMGKFLNHFGYSFDVVSTADEALNLLREKKYDVLFLDLNMPGTPGEVFIKEHRQEFPELRIIVMSVYYDKPQYVQEYIDKMAYAILKKPFDFDDVIKYIQKIEGELNE